MKNGDARSSRKQVIFNKLKQCFPYTMELLSYAVYCICNVSRGSGYNKVSYVKYSQCMNNSYLEEQVYFVDVFSNLIMEACAVVPWSY